LLIGPETRIRRCRRARIQGTLWVLETGDPADGLRPLASVGWPPIHHREFDRESPYALATFLSTVCCS
jgi:hypothetical protein